MSRRACGRASRGVAESFEQRVFLSLPAETNPPAAPASTVSSAVEIQSESITGRINVNGLVAAGRATVTGTQPDIGSFASLFDGDTASLYRTPNVDPAVVLVTFTTPKTVREFTARFSHAGGNPAYRWKVEAAGGTVGTDFVEIVPWTNTASDADSLRRLASPVNATRFRLTAERLTGDNYVHINEWTLVGDLVINSLALVPSNTSHSLYQYQQRRLRAEGVADDGSRLDLTDRVTWTSSNEAVATVDATGLVRAVGVGGAGIRASLGTLQINTTVSVGNPRQRDLNVTHIERTPRYDYDATKKNPAPGDLVTFRGHVRNWDNVTAAADYRWELDGVPVASGTLADLAPNEERVLTWQWNWQAGPHRVKLVVDPENAVAEASEVNNAVEDRTDGISVGFWVEQSLYDYFHDRQRDLAIGSNSWEDWAQRQMAKWNEHNANAVWAGITPGGVTDRVRVDKIVVVPDGALPLAGGLPSNNPDGRDKTVDMMWGFEWNPNSTFYSNTTSKAPDNPFYLEPSLVHELGHARYLIDNYTFDVHNTASYRSVQIVEPTTGQQVAGTVLMPFLAFGEVLYYNQSGGIMTGPYWNTWSPHEAGALQRIAGRRAVSGNQNAPGNIGEYLNDLPQNNHIRFVDGAGRPLAGADVRWYSAGPGPGYGGKTFDNTPERTITADANGYISLPRDPFLPGNMKEAVIRVAHGGNVWYRFFEVAEMNLEYWRGNRQDAIYTIELPLRTDPPEVEISGFGSIPIADGDSTPAAADSTYFGAADVDATGAGLGAGDERGYVIRTFVVRNTGGQPLRLTGTPRVSVFGAHASDFTVVTLPADTVTSGALTVFQVKFDPRAPGLRTANIAVSTNDTDENRYDIAIRGVGTTGGGASVDGVKFNDLGADGARDEGEPGLADWVVFGDLDADGALDSGEPAAVTDAEGAYVLRGLPTDRITTVREVQQAGWRQTFPASGSHTFNPFIDAVQTPMNFGNTQKVRVTGTVYDDRNANGVRDPGEAPLAGRELYVDLDHDDERDSDEPMADSDEQGRYAFDFFSPGPAGTTVVLLPVGGWSFTEPSGGVRQVTLSDGQVLEGQDFGNRRVVHNINLFYNNSVFDGNDPAANAADDGAVEFFKYPLLAPGSETFLNVSSFVRGINGVMIHVGTLPAAAGGGPAVLSADDFEFSTGTGGDPGAWAPAPPPSQVAVRPGAGASGTDLVTLVWPDGSIRNTWLRATLKANDRTGLSAPEVFYFGSLVAETGDSTSPLQVNALDLAAVKRNLTTAAVPITNAYDFNRDGRVNALDIAAVKGNLTRALLPIRPPAEPAVTPGPAATLLVLAEDDEGAPAPPPAVAT